MLIFYCKKNVFTFNCLCDIIKLQIFLGGEAMTRTSYKEIEVGTDRQGKFYEMKNAHLHPVYEIYYLVSGTRKFFIESDIYNISKGTLVLINKNVMHQTAYSSDMLNERTYILFDDIHISYLIEKYGRKEIDECFEQKIFPIPIQRREYVEGVIAQLDNEYKNKDEFSERLMECYLNELMIFLIRYKRHISNDGYGVDILNNTISLSNSDESIQTAAKYIMDNYSKNLTLPHVAYKVNMSSTYFSKRFKEVTGFGFKEYLLNIRIQKACELLLETRLSITEIAYKIGFNDSNYFGDVFKKSRGISPLKYRKNREFV